MLLLSEPHIIKYITFIFNHIINCDIWKRANIIPLGKRSYHELAHLRPSNILCTLSKAFELTLNEKIEDFNRDHDFISALQSGFRLKRSTVIPFQEIPSSVIHALDNKTYVCLILIEFGQAFTMIVT